MKLIPEGDEDFGYHYTHCCVYSCKYGDEQCPISGGACLPKYRCEDCTCLEMNPGAVKLALEWWNSLTPAQQTSIYLREQQ